MIGAVWNNKQQPVEVNASGKNNTKLIKSRTGHRIIFDDKQGAEKITIVDSTKKNKIILDSVNKIVKIESDGDIEIKAKNNVIMHSNALKVGTTALVLDLIEQGRAPQIELANPIEATKSISRDQTYSWIIELRG